MFIEVSNDPESQKRKRQQKEWLFNDRREKLKLSFKQRETLTHFTPRTHLVMASSNDRVAYECELPTN